MYYDKAKESGIVSAFPFRTESAIPLRWYVQQSHDWQPTFVLGLIEGAAGNLGTAKELLISCARQPNNAAFYSTRAKLNAGSPAAVESDLIKAIELDGQQWRYYKQLSELYNKEGRYSDAAQVAQTYYQKNPSHYIMGMLLAKTFLLNKQFNEAARILDIIVVIPYEGATDGRGLYKEAHLMLAVEAMKKNNYKKGISEIALARLWPERLGVGKPYAEDIDERLENFLLYQCYAKMGDKTKSESALQQIKTNKTNSYKINIALSEWANDNKTALDKIPAGLNGDENERVLAEWLRK